MNRWSKSKPYLMVTPAISVVVLLFAGGFFKGLQRSLMDYGTGALTVQYYHNLIADSEFWDALGLTLKVSSLTALISGLFSLCILWGLFMLMATRGQRHGIQYRRMLHVPMLFPYIVAAYMASLIFQQSGFLSRLFYHLGWVQQIQAFPVLVNDRFGWGMIIAYVWKTVPFMVLMLFPVLLKIQEGWYQVAQTLGANRMRFFMHIVLPMMERTWLVSVFIIFAFTFSAFEIPYFLGVTYPKTLSVMAYSLYTNGELSERPIAMAINVLLTIVTLSLGYLSYKVYQKRKVEL